MKMVCESITLPGYLIGQENGTLATEGERTKQSQYFVGVLWLKASQWLVEKKKGAADGSQDVSPSQCHTYAQELNLSPAQC